MSTDDLIPTSYRNVLRQDVNFEPRLNFENFAVQDFIDNPLNDELPTHETIEIENFEPKPSILIDQEAKNEPQFITIKNCQSSLDVLQYFESIDINEEPQDEQKLFLLKFLFSDILVSLDSTDLQEITRKCSNKSVLIVLESKNNKKSEFYWKLPELEQFLVLRPNIKLNLKEEGKVNKCVANFLVFSLENNHLGLISKCSHQSTTKPVEIDLLADYRDFNLLLLAAESGNVEIVEILLQLGMNTNSLDNKIDAQTLAMNNQNSDVLYILLQGNLKFPKKFDINKCTGRLKEFCDVTEDVHKLIIENEKEKLLKILEKNRHLRYFYDFQNHSALKMSIVAGSYEAYDTLLSMKFRFGPHENPSKYLQKLEEDDKEIVREIHNKYSEHLVDKHINVLVANSFIYHDEVDGQDKQDIISRAYRNLNSNFLIKIILMIVAASKNFKIIFDFNRDSVDVADPTVDSYTQGLFYVSGRIYIGAKQLLNQTTEHETLANLAHELCHFAMNLVYGNGANPYKPDDQKTMEEIESISKLCKENSNKDDVVDAVYDAYPNEMCHAELIVRVVHLLALYSNNPEKLREAKEIFSKLFEFFENKIVPELQLALPEIEGRDEKELKKKDEKISKFKKISIIGGVLSVFGVIAAIVVGIVFYTPTYSFDELSVNEQKVVITAPVIYKNVTIEFSDLFPEKSKIYKKLTSDHIAQMLHGEKLNFYDPHLHYLEEQITHNWENLTEKLKEKILTSNFIFQNESLMFENLHEINSDVFDALSSQQILDILDDKELVVHKMIKNETEFFLERKIFDESIYEIYFEFMKFLHADKSFYDCRYDNNTESNITFDIFYENYNSENFQILSQKIDKIKEKVDFQKCSNSDFEVTSEIRTNDTNGHVLKSYVITDTLFDHKLLQLDLNQILKIANETKIFILSAEAGTGKTVTFEQFTMRIKREYPTRWVAYIDLKEHKKLYEKVKNFDDVKKMIEKIFDLSSANEFELKIFHDFFMSGNAILLWNGFDEISPEYSEAVLRILEIIRSNTENIQFVCTRPLYSEILRDKFEVRTYTLVPFDENTQNEFVQKFFVLKKVEKEKIPDFIKKVRKIVENTESEDDFNTPLVLLMVADIISKNVEIYDTENLYEIYRKFVEKKVQIWEEKSDFARNFLKSLVTNDFSVKKFYQKYAMKSELQTSYSYLNSLKLKLFRQKVPKELSSDEISRMGILYINGPKNFKFAHRTFAEFFIAQYFIENIYNADDEPSDEEAGLRIQVFYYTISHTGIIRFVNYFLQTKTAHEDENFDPKVSRLFRTKFQKFLFNALKQRMMYTSNLQNLLSFFKKDQKVLKKLLKVDENETFYTATYNAANFVEMSFRNIDRTEIKKFGKQELTADEYQKFTHGVDQKGVILYGLYSFYRSLNSIGFTSKPLGFSHDEYSLTQDLLDSEEPFKVFEEISKNLTENETKALLTAEEILFPVILPETDFYIFDEKFLNLTEKFLTENEQKMWISTKLDDFFIPKHSKTRNLLIKKIENLFTNSEIFEVFTAKNILHILAASDPVSFADVWNFFINHTTIEQQKMVLRQKVQIECHFNPVYYVALPECYHFPAMNMLQLSLFVNAQTKFEDKLRQFKKIKEIYENHFTKIEIRKLIVSSSDFLPFLIIRKNREVCEGFVKYLREIFDEKNENLKEFLLQKIEPTNFDTFEILNDFVDTENNVNLFYELIKT